MVAAKLNLLPSSPLKLEIQIAVGLQGLETKKEKKNTANQSIQTSLLTITDSLWWSSGSSLQHQFFRLWLSGLQDLLFRIRASQDDGSVRRRRPAGECSGRQWSPLCCSAALMDAATGPQLCLCILLVHSLPGSITHQLHFLTCRYGFFPSSKKTSQLQVGRWAALTDAVLLRPLRAPLRCRKTIKRG